MSTLVLIGGTGSLSSAILKQQDILKEHGINRIRIISRCEIKQDYLEKNYEGKIELQCFLGDVRNKERMEFALKNAEYVVNTAALKIITKAELDADECFQTNIMGTRNVAKAALLNNVESAIFLSTDKAVNPTNTYGVSKLAAQHLWLWYNTFQRTTDFGVCIYGNVFNSRGSVIELWKKLAKEKRALPLTTINMTRFFITKADASKFVLQSLFHNKKEAMVPKMKSADMFVVANLVNTFYGNESGIEVVGIRPGEKVHEDLPSESGHIYNSNEAERFSSEEILEMIEHGE